jgi:hypothetical protein
MLPKDIIRVRLRRWNDYFLPWIDFKLIIDENWCYINNIRISDWDIIIMYDKDSCLCKPINIYWVIKNWVLEYEI